MLLCRKLALFDEWNSLAVYVSMDNTVVIEDISESLACLPSWVVGNEVLPQHSECVCVCGCGDGQTDTTALWLVPLAGQGS